MRNRQRASTPLESTTNSKEASDELRRFRLGQPSPRRHRARRGRRGAGPVGVPALGDGVGDHLDRLARHGSAAEVPVIIERTSGLIVDRLLAAGHPVVPVHPTAFYAARPRWGASGAKSDPGDSYKLADYLRTDGHRLRRLTPPIPACRNCRRWSGSVMIRSGHARRRPTSSRPLGYLLAWAQAVVLSLALRSCWRF